MQRAPEVISQSPPPPVSEPALSEQGEVFLLDDDPFMDVYNLSFDELQKSITQARGKHFLDDHASPTFIKERVIVSDTRRHPTTLSEAILTYTGATSSYVTYLMAENEQLAKILWDSKKEVEKI